MAKITTSLCLEDKVSNTLNTINGHLRATNKLMNEMNANAVNLKKVAKLETSFTQSQEQLEKTKLKLANLSAKYQEATDKMNKMKVAQEEASRAINNSNAPIDKETKNIEKQLSMWDKIKNSLATRFAIGNIVASLVMNALYAIRDMVAGAIKYASDLVEVQNIVDAAYGSSSKACDAWAKTTLKSYGINEMNAKRYAGTMSAMIQASGIAQKKAGEMAMNFTGLAGDLASFYNIPIDEAFNKLRSGLSGMVIPLRKIGIDISVATMQEYAHTLGIKKKWKEMSQAQKVMLRYGYVMQRTKMVQGDFVRTQYTFANQLRLVQQNWQEYTGMLAANFLPIFNLILIATNNLIYGLEGLATVWNKAFSSAMPYILGVAGVLTVYFLPAIWAATGAMIGLGLRSIWAASKAAMAWMVANLPLTLTIMTVLILISVLKACGVSFINLGATVIGAFSGVVAVLQNVATWLTDIIHKAALFFSIMGNSSIDWKAKGKAFGEELKKVKDPKYVDVGKAYLKGKDSGRRTLFNADQAFRKVTTLQTHFAHPDTSGMNSGFGKGGSDKKKKKKKRGSKSNPVYTKMSDQDINALVDVAKVNYINKFIKMQPTVQATFGDVHENADVNGLMNEMASILEEAQNSSIA